MINLIPMPKHIKELDGFFDLTDKVTVQSDFDLPLLNGRATVTDCAPVKILKDENIVDEGYKLRVSENEVVVTASTKTGAYYGLVSFHKLLNGTNKAPCCEIDDCPKLKWRGLQLDESRHFFGMDVVKELLDNMFLEKLNVFHWHLTDDQGWRIEIKKYPLLTEIGSKRKYSQIGGWRSFKCVKEPHSGYYTQDDIKEIVEYARERGIMIVPEIDFPAHCASAIAPYKYLACREIDTEVPGYFGGIIPQWRDFNWRWNRTVCCGKDSTLEFIFNVLDEVCELFDAPYLHMGGDEAPQNEWKSCELCQRVIKENNLKNESELQGWFENKILDYLKTKGKKLIAWNDVLQANNLNTDDKNIVIQYWTPKRDAKAEEYVNNGGEAILSNHQSFYFDMTYAQIPLDQTYNYNAKDFGMNIDASSNVLGYEGEVWTEWIADTEKLEMNIYPRLQALGEICWTPNDKLDFESFKSRLDAYKPIMRNMGINYAEDGVSLPQNKAQKAKILRKFFKGNPYLEVQLNKELKEKKQNEN